MAKKYLIFIFIFLSPMFTVIIVNEGFSVPERTHKYVEDYCTWYCHDVTCLHWKSSYKKEPTAVKKMHKDIFSWYVTILHNNPFGYSYTIINLIVFICCYPILGGWLLWNLIRKIN